MPAVKCRLSPVAAERQEGRIGEKAVAICFHPRVGAQARPLPGHTQAELGLPPAKQEAQTERFSETRRPRSKGTVCQHQPEHAQLGVTRHRHSGQAGRAGDRPAGSQQRNAK